MVQAPLKQTQKRALSSDAIEAINELQQLDQWVVWRYEIRDGNPTKPPYNPRTGRYASSTDCATWGTYGKAMDAYERSKGRYEGIGFALQQGSGIVGGDLDGCIGKDGKIAEWAIEIIRKIDTYTEISPSGTGVRFVCRGSLPAVLKKDLSKEIAKLDGIDKAPGLEMYSEGRYLTITGNHLPGTPTTIEERSNEILEIYNQFKKAPKPATHKALPQSPLSLSDSELINKMFASKLGTDIQSLWYGNSGEDDSRADYALLRHLAFWTGKDASRMESLFNQSALAIRDKWQERADYRQRTIDAAIESTGETYEPTAYDKRDQWQSKGHSSTHSQPDETTTPFEEIEAQVLAAIENKDVKKLLDLAEKIGCLPFKDREFLAGAVQSGMEKCKAFRWSAFKKLMEEATKTHEKAEAQKLEDAPKYRKTAAGMVLNSEDGGILISNFSAEIVSDIKADDGAEVTRFYELEAELAGRSFRFEVPADKFEECKWKDKEIGARAIITTGNSMKSHFTNAIKFCSDPDEKLLYSHAGWRIFCNGMGFLHNDGALSQVSQLEAKDFRYLTHTWLSSGPAWEAMLDDRKRRISQVSQVSQEKIQASVRFTGSLQNYVFPSECGDVKSGIRASLKVLDLTHDVITIPLYCGIWRSVLGEVDFGEHLAGQTGWGKSELCALIQQHFGASMTAHKLPGSWESTENSLEMLLFQAKDVVVVVDDFKPKGSKADQERLHAKADRIFRQIGNGSARGRLTADLQQRVERRPRCLLISTGEDVPQGQSCKARSIVLTMTERITVGEAAKKLSEAQRDARQGLYAQATAGYIEWLAPYIEAVQAQLPELVAEERDRLRIEGHARASTNTANLLVGIRFFLQYACEVEALTIEEAQAYLARCRAALIQVADEASREDSQDKQSEQWRKLIVTALTSKKAHLSNPEGKYPGLEYGWKIRLRSLEHENGLDEEEAFDGGGTQIGWIDGDDIYLDPEAAYQSARSVGGNLTTLETTLRKFLHQDGLLASTNLDKPNRKTYTIRRRLQGIQRNVLHVKKSILFSEDPYINSLDSLGTLDSQPSRSASEAPSEVSQVDDSQPSESSNLHDSDQTQAYNAAHFHGIPEEHRSLFAQYERLMPISDTKNVFWRAPGSGHENGPLKPSVHIARMRSLLQSGDREKINAALEAMEKITEIKDRQG